VSTLFSKIKFKYFQGLSDKDSTTFKDHVCFQGLSRPWKSGKKFKDFQGLARALGSIVKTPEPARASFRENNN